MGVYWLLKVVYMYEVLIARPGTECPWLSNEVLPFFFSGPRNRAVAAQKRTTARLSPATRAVRVSPATLCSKVSARRAPHASASGAHDTCGSATVATASCAIGRSRSGPQRMAAAPATLLPPTSWAPPSKVTS